MAKSSSGVLEGLGPAVGVGIRGEVIGELGHPALRPCTAARFCALLDEPFSGTVAPWIMGRGRPSASNWRAP